MLPEGGQHPVQRLGRYALVRKLAAGGMAELFLARADGIHGFTKLVAVKRILPHQAANERFVRMFLNEARLVATLDHPNIAQVYDIGIEGGEYFFAMEYIHGRDVRQIMQRVPEGALDLAYALHIAIGVCAGLHFAHEARDPSGQSLDIVHRDVNPANVLVSYEGAVKLVDFGVAKAASMVSETKEGTLKGKYGYMSPEQCLGSPLDRRSDVFALGILLWEMTLGKRLYKRNGELATLQRIVYADAPAPSQVRPAYPRELEQIVMRALRRNVGDRYQTAQDLQLDLEAFARDRRLRVSAVAMSEEMGRIFRDRISAWKDAQRAGQSLADHLVEARSDDGHVSGDGQVSEDGDPEHGSISRVIGELAVDETRAGHAGAGAGARAAPRPASVATREAPAMAPAAPAPLPRPPARSPVLAVVLFATVVAIAALWLVLGRLTGSSDDAEPPAIAAGSAAPVPPSTAPAAEPAAGPGTVSTPDAAAIAMGEDDGSAGIEIQPIEEDAAPAEGDPAAEDVTAADGEPAGEDDPREAGATDRDHRRRRSRPRARPGKPEKPAPKPKESPAATVQTGSSGAGSSASAPAGRPAAASPAKATQAPAPGAVDANKVRAVVRSHLGEIQACAERGRMADRDLAGRVELRISLTGAGKVSKTSVAKSTIANPTVESCMMKAVAGWTFPAPAGNVPAVIKYPFTI